MSDNNDSVSILVEGNIGVGKSTLIKLLCDEYGFHEVPEPVATNPYLDAFYANGKMFATPLQCWMHNIRGALIFEHAVKPGKHVFDRSIIGDWALAYANHKRGNISDAHWEMYCWQHDMINAILPLPAVIIYVTCSVQRMLERIKLRARPCEQGIKADYLEDVNEGHELSIKRFTEKYGVRVIRVENEMMGDVSKPQSLALSSDGEEGTYEDLYHEIIASLNTSSPEVQA